MSDNVVFFAWNQVLPGREQMAAEHFQDFSQYLGGLQHKGAIASFETVFLNAHGGDMNGFFLIRGDNSQVHALISSDEWLHHMTRALLELTGAGAVLGASDALVMERMQLWSSMIPA